MKRKTSIWLLLLFTFTGSAFSKQTGSDEKLFASGKEAFTAKDYKKAIEYFDLAIGVNPTNSTYYNFRSNAKLNIKLFSEALSDIDKAIKFRITAIGTDYYTRARIYYSLKEYTAAKFDLDEAIKLDSKNYRYFEWRSSCNQRRKDFKSALEDINSAIILEQRSSSLYNHRAEIKLSNEDIQGSMQDALTAIELDSTNYSAYISVGVTFYRLKKYKLAYENYRQAYDLKPDNPSLMANLAMGLARVGKFDEAIEKINSAIKSDTTNAYYYFQKARIYGISDKKQETLNNFKMAIAKDFNSWESLSSYYDELLPIHNEREFKDFIEQNNSVIHIEKRQPTVTKKEIVSLNDKVKKYVEDKINQWQQKGEFEKSSEYKTRVNETTRIEKIEESQIEAVRSLKKQFAQSINYKDISLGIYDADNESFLLSSSQLGEFVIAVPRAEAPTFKQNFNSLNFQNSDFFIQDGNFVLSHIEAEIALNNKRYAFDNKNKAAYAQTKIDYKFSDIQVDVEDKTTANNNHITKTTNTISVGKSDVDVNIPVNTNSKINTYALIIGNEDYSSNQTGITSEVNVQFAENDARIFKEYCLKTLSIPDRNITLLINATGSKMLQNLELISKIAKANNGGAELIFYYAGHGLPDEQTKEPYLIPVDVSGSDLKYAINLGDVYNKLTENPVNRVTVFLDACFSGGARNESLLALRGVKIKPKENVIDGNLVVFTSSSGDESSAPYKDKQHGMFTYYLLKKLQDSKGDCTYEDMVEYLKKEISVNSLVINKRQQTPQVIGSTDVEDKWKSWKIN